MVVNKPSGVAAGEFRSHRTEMPRASQAKFLELVHRLDREMSGVLLLAKKRSARPRCTRSCARATADKRYFVLVLGNGRTPGSMSNRHTSLIPARQKRVMVREDGQASTYHLYPAKVAESSLPSLEAQLKTGRTPPGSAHLAHLGFSSRATINTATLRAIRCADEARPASADAARAEHRFCSPVDG